MFLKVEAFEYKCKFGDIAETGAELLDGNITCSIMEDVLVSTVPNNYTSYITFLASLFQIMKGTIPFELIWTNGSVWYALDEIADDIRCKSSF